MIEIVNLSFAYGSRVVFDEVSVRVDRNKKVGVVGPNGAGKSTLFKLLLGMEMPHEGTVEILGNVGFVPQEVKRDDYLERAKSVREYLDPDAKRMDFELVELLRGLELGYVDLDSLPGKMSGGQKTKLALGRALLAEPEVLLLDEPTNFMDIAGKEFVMNFLGAYSKTLVVVSHDLPLLNKHIDSVWALNQVTKKIDEYTGNYDDFIRLRAEREATLRRQHQAEVQHIRQLEAALPKLYKFTSDKGVRARINQQKKIAQAKAKLPEIPSEVRKFKLVLPPVSRCGALPFRVERVSKRYGDQVVLDNLSLNVRRGERLVVIGVNGAGKSTLIKIMMGMEKPDAGEVERGLNVEVGYYSQEFETFDDQQLVLDVVRDAGKLFEHQARRWLAGFGFGEEKIKRGIGTLSGGEKTRLSIALLMLKNPNVLVLDEPTTYLDVLSQRIILEAIREYRGTLVLVSHEEEFVREMKPDRALLLPEGVVVEWEEELGGRLGEKD